jgi:phospholipase/carboxylesterase
MNILQAGAPLETASAAVVLLHGRGASAEDILTLAPELDAPGLAFLAPQAPGYTWYPYTFLAPLEQNEPHLSNALATVADVLASLERAGLGAENTLLLGFSQGACLASEYVARNARRYGGLAGLSGGLIGPDGTPRDYPGSLDGTPVFLGCSDPDPHIPTARVLETEQVLRGMGAAVTARLYPRMGHTINADEIAFVREMVAALPRREPQRE